jgi:hypothetical protein
METKIDFRFKKVDDRRNKNYHKKVTAYIGMEFIKRCDDEYYQHGFIESDQIPIYVTYLENALPDSAPDVPVRPRE